MKILLKVIILFLFFLSCEKEDTKPNPADLIQGKWKIILMGNGDDLRPYETQYVIEYYNDSLLREYDTILRQYNNLGQYTIGNNYFGQYTDDKILTHYYFYISDTLSNSYKFDFFDNNNKLKLINYDIIATFSTQVYERTE